MEPTDDGTLLRQYAADNSDEAFAALVARHLNLVYSVALRQAGNPHAAEEISQAVFIILARKAASLRQERALAGWLFQTTRLTANNFIRSESRRHRREEEAYMQSVMDDAGTEVWPKIAPLLDDAVAGLREQDRQAIVLRFYEGRNLREVGLALGTSEAAAEKRVGRALEKLRKLFTKRGAGSTTAILAGAISANSVSVAPVALAATISATAAKGAAVAASTMTLVKGTLKIMTYAKLKLAFGITAGILLAGGAVTVAVSQTGGGGDKLTPQEIVRQSQNAYAALSSYSDSGKIVQVVGTQTIPTTFKIRLQRPNHYRVEWTQTTEFFTNGGIVWSAGNGDYLMMSHGQYNAKPSRYPDMQSALAAATGVSGQASASIPGTFFKQNWGDVLKAPASGKTRLAKQKDESIDGVDCYVLSSSIDPANLPNQGKLPDNGGKVGKTTTTLWIGKQDYLIHQTQTIMEGASITLPRMSDATIRAMVEGQKKPVTPETMAAMRTQLDTANAQALKMMAAGKFVFTQTHEGIVLNQNFSPSDFNK
jgi:RNA polymerase sigma factor (sigma-70 family)